MARKVDLGFTPSKYQEEFFNFVKHGAGNALIDAKAGTGKTLTAISSMKLIPNSQKCLFIAFNKSIADELSLKLKGRSNCTAKTVHSLGFLMLKRNIGSDIEVDEYKYRNYVKKNAPTLTKNTTFNSVQDFEQFVDNVSQLIDFARFNLAQSVKEINNIAVKYSIPITKDECEVVKKCLEWGKANTETIDYTDMVWLPVEEHMKPIGLTYDWVFIDECQDLSQCSTELFLKCLKRGGRFVAIGDPSQSIYFFSGASAEAFDNIKNYKNTTTFKLPITYRCPKSVVAFANTLVPDLLPREDASEGVVEKNCKIKDLMDGDMVLCCSKAPLFTLYVMLLRKNKNCYIKGLDIGINLVKILNTIKMDELNSDLTKDGVFVRLFDHLFSERNKLMKIRGLDFKDATLSSYIMEMYDTLNALTILSEKYTDKEKLIKHIEKIFAETSDGICLSTVHKAKGLEADNVYILCHSSMFALMGKNEWEKKQEENLRYVAYTRAKKKLGFISEKEIKPSGNLLDDNIILKELMFIEEQVCKVLNKKPTDYSQNINLVKVKLQTKTDTSKHKKLENTISLEQPKVNKSNSSFLLELENI